MKDQLIVITYVDDTLVFGKNKLVIDNFINSLKKPKDDGQNYPYPDKGFDFTEEGSVEAFLGVKIHRTGDVIKISQPLLIERIVKAIGFDPNEVSTKQTPLTHILHKDEDSQPRKEGWHYRSVIGMLNYLANTTRPDISMAVHQCARFSNDPKLSHEKAIKHIIKYLIGTKNMGIKVRIDMKKGLEAFVDSDFASGWSKANPDDVATLYSRTGYIIYFFGIPLTWTSKLQSRIALSST